MREVREEEEGEGIVEEKDKDFAPSNCLAIQILITRIG